MLRHPEADVEPPLRKTTQASEIRGEIEFRNLNFAYNGGTVLQDVNLRIPPEPAWPSSDPPAPARPRWSA